MNMRENSNGECVKWEDYAALKARRDELEQRAEAAEAIVSELKESLAASGKMQQLHREAAQAAEAKLAELENAGDTVECASCGHAGEIDADGECAWVNWDGVVE